MIPVENTYYPEIPTAAFLNMIDSSRVFFTIETYNDERIIVDFGDGDINTFNSGVQIKHIYSENFTGDVVISIENGNLRAVKKIILQDWGNDTYYGKVGISNYNISPEFLFQFPRLEWFLFDQYLYGNPDNVTGTGAVCKTLLSGDWSQIPSYLKKLEFQNTDFNGNTAIFNADNIVSKADYQLKSLSIGWFTFSRNISIKGDMSNLFSNLEDLSLAGHPLSGTDYKINISKLPTKIKNLSLVNGSSNIVGLQCTIKQITENLPDLEYLRLHGNNGNNISGDLEFINKKIKFIEILGNNTISGEIKHISNDAYFISIHGNNSISGDIKDIPINCTDFRLGGINTIGGDIANLKIENKSIEIGGNNKIFGDLKNLKNGFKKIIIQGANTITGDIKYIPNTLTSTFTLFGNNTLYGNIGNLPIQKFGGTQYSIRGNNLISGNIQDVNMNISILGNNIISGNISEIKNTVTNIEIRGNNTISGDIGDIQSNTISSINVWGNNTIYGNISLIKSNLSYIDVRGLNQINGNIDGISSTGIKYLIVHGLNTIEGDIGGIPTNLNYIVIKGRNNINQYTSKSWSNTYLLLQIYNINPDNTINNTNTMPSEIVDLLLNDLSISNLSSGNITLRGTTAKRTSASDNAVNLLRSKNVSLDLN